MSVTDRNQNDRYTNTTPGLGINGIVGSSLAAGTVITGGLGLMALNSTSWIKRLNVQLIENMGYKVLKRPNAATLVNTPAFRAFHSTKQGEVYKNRKRMLTMFENAQDISRRKGQRIGAEIPLTKKVTEKLLKGRPGRHIPTGDIEQIFGKGYWKGRTSRHVKRGLIQKAATIANDHQKYIASLNKIKTDYLKSAVNTHEKGVMEVKNVITNLTRDIPKEVRSTDILYRLSKMQSELETGKISRQEFIFQISEMKTGIERLTMPTEAKSSYIRYLDEIGATGFMNTDKAGSRLMQAIREAKDKNIITGAEATKFERQVGLGNERSTKQVASNLLDAIERKKAIMEAGFQDEINDITGGKIDVDLQTFGRTGTKGKLDKLGLGSKGYSAGKTKSAVMSYNKKNVSKLMKNALDALDTKAGKNVGQYFRIYTQMRESMQQFDNISKDPRRVMGKGIRKVVNAYKEALNITDSDIKIKQYGSNVDLIFRTHEGMHVRVPVKATIGGVVEMDNVLRMMKQEQVQMGGGTLQTVSFFDGYIKNITDYTSDKGLLKRTVDREKYLMRERKGGRSTAAVIAAEENYVNMLTRTQMNMRVDASTDITNASTQTIMRDSMAMYDPKRYKLTQNDMIERIRVNRSKLENLYYHIAETGGNKSKLAPLLKAASLEKVSNLQFEQMKNLVLGQIREMRAFESRVLGTNIGQSKINQLVSRVVDNARNLQAIGLQGDVREFSKYFNVSRGNLNINPFMFNPEAASNYIFSSEDPVEAYSMMRARFTAGPYAFSHQYSSLESNKIIRGKHLNKYMKAAREPQHISIVSAAEALRQKSLSGTNRKIQRLGAAATLRTTLIADPLLEEGTTYINKDYRQLDGILGNVKTKELNKAEFLDIIRSVDEGAYKKIAAYMKDNPYHDISDIRTILSRKGADDLSQRLMDRSLAGSRAFLTDSPISGFSKTNIVEHALVNRNNMLLGEFHTFTGIYYTGSKVYMKYDVAKKLGNGAKVVTITGDKLKAMIVDTKVMERLVGEKAARGAQQAISLKRFTTPTIAKAIMDTTLEEVVKGLGPKLRGKDAAAKKIVKNFADRLINWVALGESEPRKINDPFSTRINIDYSGQYHVALDWDEKIGFARNKTFTVLEQALENRWAGTDILSIRKQLNAELQVMLKQISSVADLTDKDVNNLTKNVINTIFEMDDKSKAIKRLNINLKSAHVAKDVSEIFAISGKYQGIGGWEKGAKVSQYSLLSMRMHGADAFADRIGTYMGLGKDYVNHYMETVARINMPELADQVFGTLPKIYKKQSAALSFDDIGKIRQAWNGGQGSSAWNFLFEGISYEKTDKDFLHRLGRRAGDDSILLSPVNNEPLKELLKRVNVTQEHAARMIDDVMSETDEDIMRVRLGKVQAKKAVLSNLLLESDYTRYKKAISTINTIKFDKAGGVFSSVLGRVVDELPTLKVIGDGKIEGYLMKNQKMLMPTMPGSNVYEMRTENIYSLSQAHRAQLNLLRTTALYQENPGVYSEQMSDAVDMYARRTLLQLQSYTTKAFKPKIPGTIRGDLRTGIVMNEAMSSLDNLKKINSWTGSNFSADMGKSIFNRDALITPKGGEMWIDKQVFTDALKSMPEYQDTLTGKVSEVTGKKINQMAEEIMNSQRAYMLWGNREPVIFQHSHQTYRMRLIDYDQLHGLGEQKNILKQQLVLSLHDAKVLRGDFDGDFMQLITQKFAVNETEQLEALAAHVESMSFKFKDKDTMGSFQTMIKRKNVLELLGQKDTKLDDMLEKGSLHKRSRIYLSGLQDLLEFTNAPQGVQFKTRMGEMDKEIQGSFKTVKNYIDDLLGIPKLRTKERSPKGLTEAEAGKLKELSATRKGVIKKLNSRFTKEDLTKTMIFDETAGLSRAHTILAKESKEYFENELSRVLMADKDKGFQFSKQILRTTGLSERDVAQIMEYYKEKTADQAFSFLGVKSLTGEIYNTAHRKVWELAATVYGEKDKMTKLLTDWSAWPQQNVISSKHLLPLTAPDWSNELKGLMYTGVMRKEFEQKILTGDFEFDLTTNMRKAITNLNKDKITQNNEKFQTIMTKLHDTDGSWRPTTKLNLTEWSDILKVRQSYLQAKITGADKKTSVNLKTQLIDTLEGIKAVEKSRDKYLSASVKYGKTDARKIVSGLKKLGKFAYENELSGSLAADMLLSKVPLDATSQTFMGKFEDFLLKRRQSYTGKALREYTLGHAANKIDANVKRVLGRGERLASKRPPPELLRSKMVDDLTYEMANTKLTNKIVNVIKNNEIGDDLASGIRKAGAYKLIGAAALGFLAISAAQGFRGLGTSPGLGGEFAEHNTKRKNENRDIDKETGNRTRGGIPKIWMGGLWQRPKDARIYLDRLPNRTTMLEKFEEMRNTDLRFINPNVMGRSHRVNVALDSRML